MRGVVEGVVRGSGSRERARKTRAGVSFPRRRAGTMWLWGGGLGCLGLIFDGGGTMSGLLAGNSWLWMIAKRTRSTSLRCGVRGTTKVPRVRPWNGANCLGPQGTTFRAS